jgi:hypothetical protein
MKHKRPNLLLDVFALVSCIACFYALIGMVFYLAWAKIDPSMEQMWIWKRQFYLFLLIGSLIVGLPCWIVVVRDCIKARKDR